MIFHGDVMKKELFGMGILAIIIASGFFYQVGYQNRQFEYIQVVDATLESASQSETVTGENTQLNLEETATQELVIEKYRVCLDPGHGGVDPGSTTGKVYEKEQTLELTKLVRDILLENGVDAFLTRKDDLTWYLEDRVNYANGNHADVLVSIHRNFCESWITVNGIECWIHSAKRKEDVELATFIMDRLADVGKMDIRGIKGGSSDNPNENYTINRNSEMPSLILEMGYMSDKKDNEAFDNYKEEYAQAIALGILDFMEKYN